MTGTNAANTSVNYNIEVYANVNPITSLILGKEVVGTITDPGDEAGYTFSARRIGQTLYFVGQDSTFNGLTVQLTAPNGVFVQSFNTSTYSAAPFSLPFAGTYTLTVYSYGTTGSYHFTLDNLSAAPTINLSPDAGTAESNQTLATGLATNFYQIDGMAGQRLYFQALAHSAGASDLNWTLYGPSGTVVASSRFSSPSTWYDLTSTLPSDGTYLLAVTGTNPGNTSVTYNFEVTIPPTRPPR